MAALSDVVEAVREYVERAESEGLIARATFDGATAAALVGGIECVDCMYDCDRCGPGARCVCAGRCYYCTERHDEASDWLIERLVAPCTLDQLRSVLSSWQDGSLDMPRHFSRYPHSAAIACGVLAGDDRDRLAAELRKAPVPKTRAPYDRMKRAARKKRLRALVKWSGERLLGVVSPAAACNADRRDSGAARRALGSTRWLALMRDRAVLDDPENYDPRDDETTVLDPLWPPAEIHARMALVSAGRHEYAHRRLRTLALNLAAIARGRAAAASAARLAGGRAASALAYAAMSSF